jgi:Na+-transporting methylmalonyl-CoA/oxaloacetate decarboxylase gamma subunit
MNAIDSKQATIFIVVFAVLALLINSTRGLGNSRMASFAPEPVSSSTQTAVQAQQLAAQQAAQAAQQAAAAEHANFLARYVNGGFTRPTSGRSVALVVASEDGKPNAALTAALTRKFQSSAVQVSTSFFTPEFVADGLFKDALAGPRDMFNKLDLAKSVDALVLAREDVQYAQNPALDNVTTATIQLDVSVVPVSAQGESSSWTFTANGPGFSNPVARKAAEERLLKQIANDTKMSLN